MSVKINRVWAMPDSNTFNIKPISRLIHRYVAKGLVVVDPFANNNKIGTITNDIDPTFETDYNMDALDFLKMLEPESADIILYDPPYSPRQVSECYKKLGRTVNMETTQASFWGNIKKEIARVLRPNGFVISAGWNSNGIGKKLGLMPIEILLIQHGGQHNDTIVIVERKFTQSLFQAA